jgi:hypothetical protein
MNTATYYVISHYPSRFKSEHVNIGIVVFIGGDDIRVHFIDDLKKVKVVDPNAKIETIRSWESTLPALLLEQQQARAIPAELWKLDHSRRARLFRFRQQQRLFGQGGHIDGPPCSG